MFADPIRARLGAVGREIWPARSPGGGAPTWVVRASRWCLETSPMAKTLFGLKTGQNDPIRGPQVLGNFFRVLELKMSVLGLGFYLARKTRFIWSLWSFSGKNPD